MFVNGWALACVLQLVIYLVNGQNPLASGNLVFAGTGATLNLNGHVWGLKYRDRTKNYTVCIEGEQRGRAERERADRERADRERADRESRENKVEEESCRGSIEEILLIKYHIDFGMQVTVDGNFDNSTAAVLVLALVDGQIWYQREKSNLTREYRGRDERK